MMIKQSFFRNTSILTQWGFIMRKNCVTLNKSFIRLKLFHR